MSRRTDHRGDSRDAMPWPLVEVVCTGKRTHPRAVLQSLVDTRGEPRLREFSRQGCDELARLRGYTGPVNGVLHADPDSRHHDRTTGGGLRVRRVFTDPVMHRPDGGTTYVFPCPRCSRSPQLREGNLSDALDRLYAVYGDTPKYELDVSYAD